MEPDFMKLSPGHKIPAIVDHDGAGGAEVTLCESGAILKYLGEKSGKFYPSDAAARAKVDQWLFYGSATFTTLAQQFGHWTIRSPIKAPPAQQHYEANLRDMLGILDRHLASHEYFGGAYSIADMTMYSDVHIHGVRDIGLNVEPGRRRPARVTPRTGHTRGSRRSGGASGGARSGNRGGKPVPRGASTEHSSYCARTVPTELARDSPG